MRVSASALITLLALLVGSAAVGVAAPPNGKKKAHPQATHVIVTDTIVDAGGVKAQVFAGTPVAAKTKGKGKGKLKVTLAGNVELAGTVDGAALGLMAARDGELYSTDGKQVLGIVREGAFFRVINGKAKAGFTAVEAVPSGVRGQIASDALTPEPHELLIRGTWQYVTAKPTDVYAAANGGGAPRLKLPAGVRIEFLEQDHAAARVRTSGGVEIEGWVLVANLRERQDSDLHQIEPELIKPTHEMFVDGPVFAGADGKKRIGALRGGTLVEAAAKPGKGDHVKITIPGQVILEAWVKKTDLRALEASVFQEPQ